MAETEIDVASPVAPAPAPENDTHNEELPSYDDALLVRVKGKVKKPVRPDDTERNFQIEKLNAEIKKHGDRIAEIKGIIATRRNRAPNPEAVEARSKKDALRGEWNAVLAQKMHIREEFQRASTEREVVRNELRETRSKIPRGTKVETLESDIQAVEYKLEHESLSGAEEKKAHQQLSSLTAARPLARQIVALEEKLKVVEVNRAAAKGRLDQCDGVLNGIKAKEQEHSAALDAIRKEREDANVDIPALEVEKQECWEVIQAMRAKLSEVRDDYNKRWLEWSALNKNYNAWLRHDRKAQYDERQKAREARDADRDADYQAATGTSPQAEPYESEIFTIDQLLTYLRKFLVSEEGAVAKVEQKQVEVPQGLKPFKKKDEEDLSFFTAVQKKGKGKGAKQQAEKAAAPSAAEAKRKLNHSLDILKTFMSLGLDVPLNTTEISGTIEKVEAKKQDFLEKRKRAKEAPPPAAAKQEPETQELSANGEDNGHAEEVEEAAEAEPQQAVEPEAEQAAEAKSEQAAEPEAEVTEQAAEEEEEPQVVEETEEEKKVKEEPASDKDVDMKLAVDKATQEVSVKIRVSASE